jgi:hypothetical protein
MRKLNIDDVFSFSEILDVMDLQADLNDVMKQAQRQDDPQSYMGGQMMLMVMKNLHKAKEPIKQFIADVSDKKIEEVNDMKFTELKDVLVEVFTDDDIGDFFNSLFIAEQK